MIRKIRISGILLVTIILSSCIKDGVNECPEGNVKIHFYAERFQNESQDPLADKELVFNERIDHLHYYLYKNGSLLREATIDNTSQLNSGCYSLDLAQLEYGNYQLVTIANCRKNSLTGNPADPSNLVLVYPGSADTEDFFTSVLKFNVSSEETKEYEAGLSRVHGVIRYKFENMPENADRVEIIMENMSGEKWITGEYKKACNTTHLFYKLRNAKEDNENGYVIGTFPTLDNDYATYYLNIYKEGENEPSFREMISNKITITRNQLVEIKTTFANGSFSFEINLDSKWDGSSSEIETDI